MIGKTVGKYEIKGELGRGGMGAVYEGQDLRLGRSVALKFLREQRVPDRTAAERFFREARAASALNHPNIVTIFEVGEAEPGWFIAMELIRGRTLRSLAGAGLSIDKLADIGSQVAKALAIAHAAGIVHRDIKPESTFSIGRSRRPAALATCFESCRTISSAECRWGTKAGWAKRSSC
jgi:serine/threonine protein kinase